MRAVYAFILRSQSSVRPSRYDLVVLSPSAICHVKWAVSRQLLRRRQVDKFLILWQPVMCSCLRHWQRFPALETPLPATVKAVLFMDDSQGNGRCAGQCGRSFRLLSLLPSPWPLALPRLPTTCATNLRRPSGPGVRDRAWRLPCHRHFQSPGHHRRTSERGHVPTRWPVDYRQW